MLNRVLLISGAVVIALTAGWLGYLIGGSAGRGFVVRDIQGEAVYIRDQARSGDGSARAFCRAYRDLSRQLGNVSLERAFRPLRDC